MLPRLLVTGLLASVLLGSCYSPPGLLYRNQSYFWGTDPRGVTTDPLLWVYGGSAQAIDAIQFNGERALRHRRRAVVAATCILGFPITAAVDTALLPFTLAQQIIGPPWEREPPLEVADFPSGPFDAVVTTVYRGEVYLASPVAYRARKGMWLAVLQDGKCLATVKVALLCGGCGFDPDEDSGLYNPESGCHLCAVFLSPEEEEALHEHDRVQIEKVDPPAPELAYRPE
jgi:hypothetical protein